MASIAVFGTAGFDHCGVFRFGETERKADFAYGMIGAEYYLHWCKMATNFPNPSSRENYVLSILVFVLGFVTMAAVIHLLIPNPLRLHADLRSEKIELLDSWRGGVYSAAFGSSHVNDGFDPRAFDDELSAMQCRTPSVNL